MLGVFDLFKKAWEIYQDRFGTLIGIAAIPIVANLLLFIPLVLGGVLTGVFWKGAGITNLVKILIAVPLLLLAVVWVVLVTLWPAVAMLYAVKDRKEEIGFKQCFGRAWSKIASYLWIGILSGVAVTLGFILLIVPGIIFLVWFSLASYVLVVEDKKGTSALSRSKELVQGNWWDVLGRIAFMSLVAIIFSLAMGFIPIVGLMAANLLLTPFSVVFFFMLYEDLKEESKTPQEGELQRS